MDQRDFDWRTWRNFFAARRGRLLPALCDPRDCPAVPRSVARSLAIFQLGESGGGSVVGQARRSRLASVDPCYAEAMQLFVDEEHRHAEILAICVRALGGELVRRNWTAGLFVVFRRLLGLRFKVLVLLVAEVVGLCWYRLLAAALPACRVRALLEELVEDERSHLLFHCRFLRAEASGPLRRLLFVALWRSALLAAGAVVLFDHRHALRDLGVPAGRAWRRWWALGRRAERLVTGTGASRDRVRRSATEAISVTCEP